MDKLKIFNLLEQLEKKFFFKFSEANFWVLVGILIIWIKSNKSFILYGIPEKEIKYNKAKAKNAVERRIDFSEFAFSAATISFLGFSLALFSNYFGNNWKI